jgi:hypothetical protein
MQLGSDYSFWKDLMTPPCTHAWQFKEMFWTTKALLAGNWPKPLEVLALQWFYMSFHKNNSNKFVTADKKLETKTFKSVTEFFESQFNQNKNNCTLKCMELERIKKRLHLKLKSKRCNKICARKDKHRIYPGKRKLASRNARRRSYDGWDE